MFEFEIFSNEHVEFEKKKNQKNNTRVLQFANECPVLMNSGMNRKNNGSEGEQC